MTEAEWLACTDPQKMLEFLRGKASDRKLRLFACTCSRRVLRPDSGPDSHEIVEAVERLADGEMTVEEMRSLPSVEWFEHEGENDRIAIFETATPDAISAGMGAADGAAGYAGDQFQNAALDAKEDPSAGWRAGFAAENVLLCQLLREIFGNSFRPATLDPSWLNSNVVKLAQAIYNDRAFDRLPKLADALEEAGCENADVVAHFRQPGDHVRGCWAVDLILGKE